MPRPQERPEGGKSIAEIATDFGASQRQVRRWIEEGCPVAAAGGPFRKAWLDPEAVRAWRGPKEGTKSNANAGSRLKTAQAEKVETENRVRRGQLVERALVVKVAGETINHAKARLLAGPSALAARLVEAGRIGGPLAVQGLLDTWLREVLADLSITLPSGNGGGP